MNWILIADVLGAIAICVGAVFTLIAAIGVLRYRDLLSRQHVATKPQVFSLLCYFLGVALLVRESSMTWTLLLVIMFQLVTAPISAHMISRTGYRTGRFNTNELLVDELGEDIYSGDDAELE